jgi:hypothetical protein
MSNYLRGQIAKMANINIETLRYYENNELESICCMSLLEWLRLMKWL